MGIWIHHRSASSKVCFEAVAAMDGNREFAQVYVYGHYKHFKVTYLGRYLGKDHKKHHMSWSVCHGLYRYIYASSQAIIHPWLRPTGAKHANQHQSICK